MTWLLAAPPIGAQTAVDYDADNNRLIEIDSPAQLNAIRYDLDGDGTVDSSGDQTSYDMGFPNAAAAQCPTGCQGYELDANLDLASAFPNWTPIGAYTAAFDGRGRTISGLSITSTSLGGLFAALGAGGVIRNVGLLDPSVSSSGVSENIAALVGRVDQGANIDASYVAGGSVTVSGADARAGGLAGQNNGRIRASYSTAAVSATGNPSGVFIGGLVGFSFGGQLTASYAAGPVTPGTGSGVQAGGLVGRSETANAGAVNSYCDTAAAALDDCIGAAVNGSTATAAGYATAHLRRPTGYDGLFSHWNLDLDGDDTIDWLWNFGGVNDYPRLNTPAQRRAARPSPRDYDANDNNLIDIYNLSQLNALRWDANGDGAPEEAANAGAYTSAFPGRAADEAGRMGCPDTCAGYELRRNLTFPTETGAPYRLWTPISGAYNAIFDGNGRSLTGLKVDGLMNAGLFSVLGAQAVVQKVGLIKPEVAATTRLSFFRTYAGALAGQSSGRIHTSYVRGGSVSVNSFQPSDSIQPAAGGLVGLNRGAIRSAWSTARVSNAGAASDTTLGGLVGRSESGEITAAYAAGPVSGSSSGPLALGGLVGYSRNSAITASYARGAVSGSTSSADPDDLDLGGLVGYSWGGGEVITNGYCDAEASGPAACVGALDSGSTAAAPGYDTDGLRTPTGYAGLYEDWDVDVGSGRSLTALLDFSGPRGSPLLSAEFDGDGRADRPWDFGGPQDYPLLRADFNGDGKATWAEFGRQYRFILIHPYNPAADHPESYANPRHEMSAACEVRTTGEGAAAVTTATLTFDLGRYTRPVTLALSLWDGAHYRSLQSLGLPMPTLQRQGQTATVEVTTDPARTRFRIDGQYGLNLVLGYADCRTDDP